MVYLACGWWSIQQHFQPKCHRLQIRMRVTKCLFVVWSAHTVVFKLMLSSFRNSSCQSLVFFFPSLYTFISLNSRKIWYIYSVVKNPLRFLSSFVPLKGFLIPFSLPALPAERFLFSLHLDNIYQYELAELLHRLHGDEEEAQHTQQSLTSKLEENKRLDTVSLPLTLNLNRRTQRWQEWEKASARGLINLDLILNLCTYWSSPPSSIFRAVRGLCSGRWMQLSTAITASPLTPSLAIPNWTVHIQGTLHWCSLARGSEGRDQSWR